MEKYEKIEFDMNSIDSAFMKSKLFKGMEFIFDQMDTSRVTGKTYLPIFINESLNDVYGDNKLKKVKEKIGRILGFLFLANVISWMISFAAFLFLTVIFNLVVGIVVAFLFTILMSCITF